MKQQIRLSDHFTYKRLLRFTLSPILMMIFTSVYSVVDGVFVSVVAGDIPFKAVNLIYPFIMMLGAFGFMMGAGGTAVVSKTLGEGDKPAAQRYFTFIVIFTAAMGVVLAALGLVFVEPITALLGGEGEIYNQAVVYARILLTSLPLFMLQNLFQSFFIAAEKPKLGFAFTVASGVANMVLDALFVAVFKWGIVGAAVATAVSQLIGGIAPVVYFARKNGSLLRFVKTGWHGKVLFDSCTNGSSELLSNIAMSLVSMVYNKQLLAIVGDDGVGAYGVVYFRGNLFGVFRRHFTYCRVQLRRTKQKGTAKYFQQVDETCRHGGHCDVRAEFCAVDAAWHVVFCAKQRARRHDGARYEAVFILFSVLRIQHFRFGVFYRAGQRTGVGVAVICAYVGVPAYLRVCNAAYSGLGRRVAQLRRR